MITIDLDFVKNVLNYIFTKTKPTIQQEVVSQEPHRPLPIPVQQPVPVIHQAGEISTFEEAVDALAAEMRPEEFSSPFFHMTTGMNIRNQLCLWRADSALHQHMLQRFGLCHADDTSMLINHAVQAKLNGETYDPEPDLLRIRDHWFRHGYDPATMQRVSTSVPGIPWPGDLD
jgi:hypothetical protein